MEIKGTNLMVDFETLDTKPGAILLSVGIVSFNKDGIIKEGYSEFDYYQQRDAGRTTSKSTIAWWLRSNKKELRRLQRNGKLPLFDWVERTTRSLKIVKPRAVWSRGYMDYAILQELFGEGRFPFWRHRDVRTLDEFGLKMKTNNHNALDDCKNQIDFVLRTFERFR